MADTEDLPEDIILNIFSKLPIKSLIRFTSVSKRLHFIILYDRKFARSQLKAARAQNTLRRRLLVHTYAPEFSPHLESLNLNETSSFGDSSSVERLGLPFQHNLGRLLKLLGSCNGLLFVAFHAKYHIWNPSIRFFKELPDGVPSFFSITFYGVGYLPETDDYKVLVASSQKEEVRMFSFRANFWKTIQVVDESSALRACGVGILLHEALNWVKIHINDEIVVFDLAQEEFRTIPLPNFQQPDDESYLSLGVSFGGRLCAFHRPRVACESTDFWVMREYDMRGESWTKLLSLRLTDPPEEVGVYLRVLVMENSIVVERKTDSGRSCLLWIDHQKQERLGEYVLPGDEFTWLNMLPYDESLFRIHD